MIIPKLHYIVQGNSSKELLDNINKACTSGAELVQLSVKNVSNKKGIKLAKEARDITAHFQTRLIIKSDYLLAKEIKADGVYLDKNDSCATKVRKYLFTWQSIGATANNFLDCETLISKDVDYICLAPFRSTDNLADSVPALGLNGYSAIVDVLNTQTPIIGYGNITTMDIKSILNTGVSGIAISTEITQNFNNIKTFNQLLNASSTEEKRHTF